MGGDPGRHLGAVPAVRPMIIQLLVMAPHGGEPSCRCFLQDILVRPAFQKEGVGRALLARVLERYQHVRQTVLITDDEPGPRAFYEAMGFTEGSNFNPEPIRVFAQFR